MHNLVTEANGVILDRAAGEISSVEAAELLRSLNAALGRPEVQFHAGRGFMGVTVLPLAEDAAPVCLPPEEAVGRDAEKCLPRGDGSDVLRR